MRAGNAELVAAPGKDGVHEAGAGHDRRRRGNAHVNGEGNEFLLVKLGRNLIGVGTRRNLEGGFVLPAQILAEAHPVVADVPAAPELLRGGHGLPAAQRAARIGGGMLNHGNDRPDIDILIDDHFLAGGLIHDLGGQGLQNAVVDLELQFLAVLATEHLGDDLVRTHHVGRQTGIGIAFDVVENHREAAVQTVSGDRSSPGWDRLLYPSPGSALLSSGHRASTADFFLLLYPLEPPSIYFLSIIFQP